MRKKGKLGAAALLVGLAAMLALPMIRCGTDQPMRSQGSDATLPALPPTPLFDPDSAYAFVAKQVSFGPRVPGSPQHAACADWMVAKLKGYGSEVTEQKGTVKAFNGKELPLRNIIASFNPLAKERILLLAHYDTRPFADKDEERPHEPILGANDGGSGVGILLELARHLSAKEHGPGIDMLFTDVEDYGQPSGAMGIDEKSIDTWALGSQHFAKNPHVAGYSARFGILLDMCGAKDARFYREALSMKYAPAIVAKVWRTADAIGHSDRFVQETKFFVGTDDHLPINERLRIPTIDIIEFHESTNAFHPSWHTHDDDMDVIDPATLDAVGRTVLEVVWKER
ncbi:MAG: M28 family peptidase [Flavobacteriales bacterium]|nr:M28 family peptidase [Flavobacteriales bacterium]